MKRVLLAATIGLIGATGAQAAGLRGMAGAHLYTCAHDPLSRVALTAAQAAPCCDGKLQCPQFLSTTTLLKPKRTPHT